MDALEGLLGRTPRVRVLQALLRLGGLDFTGPELAAEADLYKASTYRVMRKLADEGMIHPVRTTRPAVYRANRASTLLRLLGAFSAAIATVRRDPEQESDALDSFRRRAAALAIPPSDREMVTLVKNAAGTNEDALAVADRASRHEITVEGHG